MQKCKQRIDDKKISCDDDHGDDDGDVYIMMKCVFVCLSRKMSTFPSRAERPWPSDDGCEDDGEEMDERVMRGYQRNSRQGQVIFIWERDFYCFMLSFLNDLTLTDASNCFVSWRQFRPHPQCSMLSEHKIQDFILVQKGGLVKIALGGALYSMGQYVTSVEEAARFAEQMQASHNIFGVLDVLDKLSCFQASQNDFFLCFRQAFLF